MKTLLIALGILLLPLITAAQTNPEPETLFDLTKPTVLGEKGVTIHMMPLSLLNNPSRIRLGVQYKHKRFSYLFDLEHGTDKLRIVFGENFDPDYKFWGFRPELRYHTEWSKGGMYFGLEVPLTLKYESHRGNLVDQDQNVFSVDDAFERRVRISGIFKIGWQVLAFRRVLLDAYIGGGVAYRHLRFTDFENVAPPLEQPMEWGCCQIQEHGGRYRAELALGLRMGYWFPTR